VGRKKKETRYCLKKDEWVGRKESWEKGIHLLKQAFLSDRRIISARRG